MLSSLLTNVPDKTTEGNQSNATGSDKGRKGPGGGKGEKGDLQKISTKGEEERGFVSGMWLPHKVS